MPLYFWSSQCVPQQCGLLYAPALSVALSTLQQQQWESIRCKQVTLTATDNQCCEMRYRFFSHLERLLNAKIPLQQALYAMSMGLPQGLERALLQCIQCDLKAGSTLSETLKQHRWLFEPLHDSLIDVGEITGNLGECCTKLKVYEEKVLAFRKNLKKKLLYPKIVIGTACLLFILLLVFILPSMNALYASSQVTLPRSIRCLNQFVFYLQQPYGYGIGCLVLSIFFRKRVRILNGLKQLFQQLPGVRQLSDSACLMKCLQVLSLLQNANMPVSESLSLAARVAGQHAYAALFMEIKQRVISGMTLSDALVQFSKSKRFKLPTWLHQMLIIGETQGELKQMLFQGAILYEKEHYENLETLFQWIDPAITLTLSLLVGSFVLAIYLPLLQMGNLWV